MLSLHRTLSLRYLRQHWTRAVLIVASIALGVATLVATRVLSQSMARTAHETVNPLAGQADFVVARMEAGVPRSLTRELAQVPGVREARPLVIGRVALQDLDSRTVRLVGAETGSLSDTENPWGLEIAARPAQENPLGQLAQALTMFWPVRWGDRPRFALVGSSLVTEVEQKTGRRLERLRIWAGGKEQWLQVAGTVAAKADGPAAALGQNVVFLRIEDAAAIQFPHRPELVSRIDVTLAPDADRDYVRTRLTELVGGLGDVRTQESRDEAVRDVTAGLELGFDLGGAGALVVGLFMVYNALAVSVAERRHDIGILRSVGATRSQVGGLFAGEAALLGLVGSLLGLPLGILLANVGLSPAQRALSDIFIPLEGDHVLLAPRTLAAGALAGVAVSLLAALVPAVRAAYEEPADAVRRVPRSASLAAHAVQVGASLLLVAVAVLLFTWRAHLPPRYGAFVSFVVLFVGIVVAMPALTALCGRLLQPLTRQLLGVTGRLAADNLVRSSGRTGLVIGALAASLALVFGTSGVTLSTERAVLAWIDQRIAADLFVSSNSAVTSGGQMLPMQPELTERLASDGELSTHVERALPVRFHQVKYRQDRIVFLIVLDAGQTYEALRSRGSVPGLDLYPRLSSERDTVLVSENFAALHGVSIGDRITLPGGRDGPVEVHVVGTLADYTWNRGVIFMDRRWFLEKFDDPLVDLYHVFLRPGATAAAARDVLLRKWGAEQSLVVMTRPELRGTIRGMLLRLYAVIYAQAVVVGMVAVLGVVMALLISVLQRRRELGLLRAVGATQMQVLRTVLAEALLMGLTGAAIGLVLGVLLEWYAVNVLFLEDAGLAVPLQIPWQAAGLVVAAGLVAAMLAGLGPALHAVRIRIADAIAYE